MDPTRRFIFNGSAVAFGGRLVRPTDVILASDGASALSVAGGRVVWSTRDQQFGRAVRIRSANTFAEGLFDDLDAAVAVTHGKATADSLSATTVVAAEVKELSVGDLTATPPEPELRVRRVRGSLISKSPTASYEASIKLGDDTVIEGVTVGRHKLVLELEKAVFQRYDTRAKLLTAADDPKFVKAHGRLFGLTQVVGGKVRQVSGRLINPAGLILATIVREIRWDGEPFPGSEIDHNTVRIPNFGKVHFGEMLIRSTSRRLTMVRLALGSPTGGDGVCIDVDTNGSWST
jgi:hypothetical protein